jgi:hypothetical protein
VPRAPALVVLHKLAQSDSSAIAGLAWRLHRASVPPRTIAQPAAPTRAASAVAPAPAAHRRVPTEDAASACNQQAALQAGSHDGTLEVVKDAAIGAVLGATVGAACGAIAGGGQGAGKGAAP